MSKEAEARDLSSAFLRMSRPASKGGTGGTFTAAATKAGHADSPGGRSAFAREVLNNPDDYSPKMRRKAQFYQNVISK
jgi:hypothetical protein